MSKETGDVGRYPFTPLDIATYIKWSQLSGEKEYRVIVHFWELRLSLLSKACGSRFDTFKNRVYAALRQLWERHFVDEYCPLSRALDVKRAPPTWLLPKEAELELYLKLMAMHLILTEHLPIISIQWAALLRKTGVKQPSKRLWSRIAAAAHALMLKISSNGHEAYTVDDFLENRPAQLSLKG